MGTGRAEGGEIVRTDGIRADGGRTVGKVLEPATSFGPYDALAEWTHRLYLDGFGELAVRRAREGLAFCEAVGDEQTARYLSFVCGVALHQLGRSAEAAEEAGHLLARLRPDQDVLWRAKALALLAEARIELGLTALAMDHLAEGRMLVAGDAGRGYSHVSATMSVALALRALVLYEPADELMVQMLGDRSLRPDVMLNVVQEAAVLQVSWGAMLEVVGRPEEAREHYAATRERAARMRALALEVDYPEMRARAEAIEGFVLQRTGDSALAVARLRPAMAAFRLREELAETQIARLGLAMASADTGDFATAEDLGEQVASTSNAVRLDVWVLTAFAVQARNAVVRAGAHPAVAPMERLARASLQQLWEDRESRFESLQDRIRIREMTEQAERRGRTALEDPLTGLGNRRRLQQLLERPDQRFVAVYLDVDRFAQVNEEHGPEAGDDVLRRLADLLRRHCRSEDVVIRYGGDEFAVLLPVVDGIVPDGHGLAARLHRGVGEEDWTVRDRGLRVSVSLGVGGPASAAEALSRADNACTAAKRGGRDRVFVAA